MRAWPTLAHRTASRAVLACRALRRRHLLKIVPTLSILFLAACPAGEQARPPATPIAPVASAPPPVASAPGGTPSAPKPEAVLTAECATQLRAMKDHLATLLAVTDARTIANTLEPFNTLSIELTNLDGRTGLLAEVHPDAAYRAASEQCVKDVASDSRKRSKLTTTARFVR